MKYLFKCKCGHKEELDIPMDKYDSLKDKQFCVLCRGKMNRVIEWTGVASGYGEGWHGRSDGGKAI